MVGKSQLVDALVSRGAGRSAATAAVGAMLDEITSALVSGDRVTITGFGTFEAVARPERTARNPRTGATVAVPATTVVRFHPGAGLRGAVASGDGGPRAAVALDGLAVAPAQRAAANGDETVARAAPAPFKAGKELKPLEVASGKAAKPATASEAAKATKDAKSTEAAKGSKDGTSSRPATVSKDAKSSKLKPGKDAKHGKDRDAKHGKDKDAKHGKAHDAKAKAKGKGKKK